MLWHVNTESKRIYSTYLDICRASSDACLFRKTLPKIEILRVLTVDASRLSTSMLHTFSSSLLFCSTIDGFSYAFVVGMGLNLVGADL
mmetsp:Transcript_10994/g.15236  ORF Transcript_10994/g.15236 Transcript_10994/m.15236 type:complete len:88 (-) Transcript_10994:708-971(-)